MENKLFKSKFSVVAKKYDFFSAFSGWYKKSEECLVVLELQKSNFSNLYYLNIYVYVQGYNNQYINTISKQIMKGAKKILFRREEKKYSPVFNQENALTDEDRMVQLDLFFKEWLIPFTEEALSKKGVIKLIEKGDLLGSKKIIEKIQALTL